MKPLIQNFKEVEVQGHFKGLMLDLENCTPLELNMFIGYMMNKIEANDVFNPRQYEPIPENSVELIHYGLMGRTVVIRDNYYDHDNAHLLFYNSKIVTVYDAETKLNYGMKMTVVNGSPMEDGEYDDCGVSAKFFNEAGLKTLAKVLAQDSSEHLIALHTERLNHTEFA